VAEVHQLWEGFDGPEQPAGVPDVPGAEVRPLVGPATAEVVDQVRHELGIGVPRQRYRPPGHPDVSGLRREMGV
jgi:hypothetical protein